MAVRDEQSGRLEATPRDSGSEDRLRSLVEGVRDHAVFLLDPEGRVASWNAGAERLYGYQASEIVGQPYHRLHTPRDVAEGRAAENLKLARESGELMDQGWRQRKDGSRFWAEAHLTPLFDASGQLRGFAKVTLDVTRRKRAKDTLRSATLLLAYAFDFLSTLNEVARLFVPQMADGCLVELLDEKGELQLVAVAHVEPEQERRAWELAASRPAEPDPAHGSARVLRTGKAEMHREDGLGPEHPAILRGLGARSYICVPLAARGRIFGAITLLRVPGRDAFTPQHLTDALELGQRSALSIDNARLYEQARQALRLRDEFLYIASHELRTPITTLQLQLDSLKGVLRQDGPEDQNGRVTAKLDTLARQTARLAALVEGLLDVGRISAGGLTVQRQPMDLAALVTEVVERLQPEARRAGCEIETDIQGPLVGSWDGFRLEQVVSNLLSNALKYGAGRPVSVSLYPRNGHAVLVVRDRGIGIPADKLGHIFGRFERAVPLRAYGGLGIGLYVTREIVEAHGGTVLVDSRPAFGSTFTVELPLQSASSSEEERS